MTQYTFEGHFGREGKTRYKVFKFKRFAITILFHNRNVFPISDGIILSAVQARYMPRSVIPKDRPGEEDWWHPETRYLKAIIINKVFEVFVETIDDKTPLCEEN